MSPVLQVIIGELIGVAIFLGMLRLSSLFDSFSSLVVLIVGSVVLVAVFAYFYMGEQNFYFSENVLKNIFIIIMYEELLCIAMVFVTFIISGLATVDFTDFDFSLFYFLFLFIASALIGSECFYKAIVSVMA